MRQPIGAFGVVLAVCTLLMTSATIAQVTNGATRLPIRRVILYKNGIGYFEHLGKVIGNQTVSIDFTSAQLNDALKSLTTLDLGGGRIAGVSYNSQAPLSRQLDTLRLPLNEKTTRTALFEALRGARVTVRGHAGAMITGRILSIERRTRDRDPGRNPGASAASASASDVDQLVIVADDGSVHTTVLDNSVSVSLADAEMRRQLASYLDLVSAARAPDLRRMLISTTGEKQRPLFVSYISEVPVWKTTYRIVLPSAADRKPLLQGWAIIDNTIGEDWTDVELSLVAGAPQSFIQQLSQPYYGSRPIVPLPAGVSTTPQTHDAALRTIQGGFGAVLGTVSDAEGVHLPGASIELQGPGGVRLMTTSDSAGHYEVTNVPSGMYRIAISAMGFTTFVARQRSINPDEVITVDAKLQVGGLTETVEVSAASPTINTSSSAAAPSMAPAEESLELNAEKISEGLAGGVESQASTRDLGDLFEYHLKEHVTIRKNESALVPIVSSDVGVEKVSVWRETDDRPRPLRALWITNGSGLTLDGGSFMVIEGEAFAGEGLMDSMKPAERRLISYATDLGLIVARQGETTPRKTTRIHIDHGVITQYSEERQRTTFTARNEDTTARDLIVEHPTNGTWKLVSGPKPEETTATASRFRLRAEPKSTATLSIEEVHPIESRTAVSSLNDRQVALILAGQALSPAAQQALQTIRAKKAELAAIAQAQQARSEEVKSIGDDQERVRENLKAVQVASGDKSLIARYTRQLTTQEDRLEVLRRESHDADSRQKATQAEVESLIRALNVDVNVATATAAPTP